MRNNKFLEEFNFLKSNGIFFSDRKHLIVAKYNGVYLLNKKTKNLIFKGHVKIPWYDNIFKYFRFYQRLRRLIFYNIIPIGNNRYFLSFSNKIGYLDEKGDFISIINKSKSFKILNNGLSVDGDYIYYGEYFANNKRDKEVSIYRFSKKTFENKIVYSFPPKNIRHIHGIYKDPFTKYFYVLTGDMPNECRIYISKDKFKSVQLIGGGDESWRAVSLVFTERFIYYGTDSEFISNHVYSLNKKSFSRKKIGSLSGPVYYSVLYNKNPLFFITAEMCPSQNDKFFKIIEYNNDKLNTRFKVLKDYNSGKKITKIFSRLFMPGNMHLSFHNDKNMSELYVYAIGLKNFDDKVCKLK